MAVGEKDGGEHFVDGAEKTLGDDAFRDVAAEDALLLAAADDFADGLEVADDVVMRELLDELCALTHFGLHEDGHAAIAGGAFKMEPCDEFELLAGVVEGLELFFDHGVEVAEEGIEGGAEDVVLAFEVEIDGAVGDAGAGGDGADGGVEVATLGDDFYGGVEDALVLFTGGGGRGGFGRGGLRGEGGLGCFLGLQTRSLALGVHL